MTEKEKQTTIASASLELLISTVGLIIAIIFAVVALGLAIWAMQVFGITGDVARAAALDSSCDNHRTNYSGIRH
jgi:hypothetical protein